MSSDLDKRFDNMAKAMLIFWTAGAILSLGLLVVLIWAIIKAVIYFF